MINQNIEPLSQNIYDKAERFLSNYKVSTFPSQVELQEKVNVFLKLEGNTLPNKVGIIISLSSWDREVNESFYKRNIIPFKTWKKKFALTLASAIRNPNKIIWITQWHYENEGSYYSDELASYNFPF